MSIKGPFMAGSLSDLHKQQDPLSQDYKGIVVVNKDPLMLRRIKVIVEGIFEVDESMYESLPWCMPGDSPSGLGQRNNSGTFKVPELHSVVGVYFPTSDQYAPYYKGWADDVTDTSLQTLFGEDYPNTHGSVDSTGVWTRSNKTENWTEYKHPSGAFIHMDGGGNVQINIPGNLTVKVGGTSYIESTGNLGVKCIADIGINGKAIGIKSLSTYGVEAQQASIQAAPIWLDSGVVYPTESAVMSELQAEIEKVKAKLVELEALAQVIKEQGKVVEESQDSFSKSLTGTRST